jgi:hypothetical protein
MRSLLGYPYYSQTIVEDARQRASAAREPIRREDAPDGVKSYALDPDNADRLWEMSETLVGERFPLRS